MNTIDPQPDPQPEQKPPLTGQEIQRIAAHLLVDQKVAGVAIILFHYAGRAEVIAGLNKEACADTNLPEMLMRVAQNLVDGDGMSMPGNATEIDLSKEE